MSNVGKNLVIVLALVAAGFFSAWLRFRPYLGNEGRYTDGMRSFDVSATDEVRYAIWRSPAPVPGEVNGPESEHRPSLSPDGATLVFAVGERGLGADLWVADVVGGRALDPRPLTVLNSDADEWAPAFGAGALYFASDRLGTSGGLDLYRAPYDAGLFERPERLGGGINSSSDDTDPAPVPGSASIAFASDRASGRLADFDLYLARPLSPGELRAPRAEDDPAPEDDPGDGAWRVEALTALNTAFDERDPAFTTDGRDLFFASDRDGGRGGFDLYRSALGADGWVPPEPLVGVNGPGSERGPCPTADGFELYLSIADAPRDVPQEARSGGPLPGVELPPSDLYSARSLELFRNPGRPVGWRELLVLAALLLLALLAWAAKQWEQLEVLYKCLLVSLVVHLLLMWWFRDVYPQGGEYELRGDSHRIRVRLASNPAGPALADAERGGELEVARADSNPGLEAERFAAAVELGGEATPEATTEAPLERAAGPQSPQPERRVGATPDRARREATPVSVDEGAEAFERLAAGAEALAVEAGSGTAHAERAPTGAARRERAPAAVASAGPAAERQVRAREGAALPAAPAPQRDAGATSELPTPRDGRARVALTEPREDLERLTGQASKLALGAGDLGAEAPRREAEAVRSDPGPAVLVTAGTDRPRARTLPRDGAREGAPLGVPRPRATTSESRPLARVTGLGRTDVRDGEPETFQRLSADARVVDLQADGTRERVAPPQRSREGEPERPAVAPGLRGQAQPVPTRTAALTRGRDGPPDAPLPRASTPESRPLAETRELSSPGLREREAQAFERLEGDERVRDLLADGTPGRATVPQRFMEREPERSAAAPGLRGEAQPVPTRTGALTRGRDAPPDAPLPWASTPESRPLVEARELSTQGLRDGLRDGSVQSFERLQGDERAADLTLDARSTTPPVRRHSGEPLRAELDPDPRGEPDLVPRVAAVLLRREREGAPLAPAPAPRTPDPERLAPSPRSPPEVELERIFEALPVPDAVAQVPPQAGAVGIERELETTLLALAPTPARDRQRDLGPPSVPRPPGRGSRPVEPVPGFSPLATAPAPERGDEAPTRITRWVHTPYRSRAGAEKLQALELHGGSQETEAAVAAGLAYLADEQKAGGHWGSAADRHSKYEHVVIGKTGLALLAFLGAGHTQESGTEYTRVVERAVGFLIAVQDEDTGHFGYCTSYGHGIATYALAECYALTGDDRLRGPLERSVAWIVSQQMRSEDPRFHGGWGYYYPDGRIFDRWPRASITAWQIMALESARLGGLAVEDRVFADAKEFLVECWDARRGAYRYSHDPDRLSGAYAVLPGSTPASLFALSLLGEDVASARYGRARAFVLDRAPQDYGYTTDDDFVHEARGNLYFWYYATLALFRVGGEPWREWNEAMKASLLPSQGPDGSWQPISIYAREYAGDSDGDRSYSTAMCVLSLEVYYRYFTPLLKVD